MSRVLLLANSLQLTNDAPSRVLLLKWGTSRRRDGQTFTVNAESAASIIADFNEHGVDQPIDTEHQTLGGEFKSPDGRAPAVGWYSKPEAVEGEGIYVNAEWTDEGKELIRSKKYRYLSPVIKFDSETKAVIALHSAGLTNKPAVAGSPALANKEDSMIDREEILKEARWFLRLPLTATENDVMDGLEKLLGQLREMAGVAANADQGATIAALSEKLKATPTIRVAVCKELGIADSAKDEEIVGAVTKLKTALPEVDPRKYVSIETHNAVVKRLENVEAETLATKTEAFLKNGEDAGKITPDTRDFWTRIFKADPAQAEKDLEKQPAIIPGVGRMVNTERKPARAGGGKDAILANADRFDGERLTDYERITKYAAEHKVSFEQAAEICQP